VGTVPESDPSPGQAKPAAQEENLDAEGVFSESGEEQKGRENVKKNSKKK
jgi:hypothetical protein